MTTQNQNVAPISLSLTVQDAEYVFRAIAEHAARCYHELLDDLDRLEVGGVPERSLEERNDLRQQRDALRRIGIALGKQVHDAEVAQ